MERASRVQPIVSRVGPSVSRVGQRVYWLLVADSGVRTKIPGFTRWPRRSRRTRARRRSRSGNWGRRRGQHSTPCVPYP
eukprot:8799860-Pyramimonas_sp.AAC.1